MIQLEHQGNDQPPMSVFSGDIGYLRHIADTAFDRGETVRLRIPHGPWRTVSTIDEVDDVLDELYTILDARLDAQAQLPLGDLT